LLDGINKEVKILKTTTKSTQGGSHKKRICCWSS